MNVNSLKFEVVDNRVLVHGYPELEGHKGIMSGDGMAFFFGPGEQVHVANTLTGTIRCFSTVGGILLVDDKDIDYSAIERECEKGIYNARGKAIRYEGMNRWDGFKDGVCALSWMLYPDGCYFADSDGYGMEPFDEEVAYAIIDTALEIVEPFRPIKKIDKYLESLRERRRNGGAAI